MNQPDRQSFQNALRGLINSYSMENESDTPDYVLAQYVLGCLNAFTAATRERDRWHNYKGISDESKATLRVPGTT